MTTQTPPGWYADPDMAGTLRYWDGSVWTDHRSAQAVTQPRPVSDGTNTAAWAHLGPLIAYGAGLFTFGALALLAFVPPLVIMSSQPAKESPFIRSPVESLNFQLSQLVFSIIAVLPMVIFTVVTAGLGLLLLVPAVLAWLVLCVVFMVKAAVAASANQPCRYPLTIRFVN